MSLQIAVSLIVVGSMLLLKKLKRSFVLMGDTEMSDRPSIPWCNHCMSKHSYGIRSSIREAYKVYAKAVMLKKEAEQREKEELQSLIKFESVGRAN
jgi:hypothetical protein